MKNKIAAVSAIVIFTSSLLYFSGYFSAVSVEKVINDVSYVSCDGGCKFEAPYLGFTHVCDGEGSCRYVAGKVREVE